MLCMGWGFIQCEAQQRYNDLICRHTDLELLRCRIASNEVGALADQARLLQPGIDVLQFCRLVDVGIGRIACALVLEHQRIVSDRRWKVRQPKRTVARSNQPREIYLTWLVNGMA